jgi:drug/metabolite transporter (DMT)-like permease
MIRSNKMNSRWRSNLITLAPATFVVLWATGFVVSKLSAGHVGPLWFLTLRFPIAGLFMAGVAWQQRAPWPDARHAFHAMVAGGFMHGLYLGPIYWAVAEGLPAGVAALIVGLQPLLTAFMAALILGEVINIRRGAWPATWKLSADLLNHSSLIRS